MPAAKVEVLLQPRDDLPGFDLLFQDTAVHEAFLGGELFKIFSARSSLRLDIVEIGLERHGVSLRLNVATLVQRRLRMILASKIEGQVTLLTKITIIHRLFIRLAEDW